MSQQQRFSGAALVQVAIPSPLPQAFDYRLDQRTKVPEPLGSELPPIGVRVRVPFGSRQVVGFLVGYIEFSSFDAKKIKSVASVLDSKALLADDIQHLTQWLCRYYHQPAGMAYQLALPKKLRTGSAAELTGEEAWQLTKTGAAAKPTDILGRAPRQAACLQRLQSRLSQGHADTTVDELCKADERASLWRPAITGLAKKDWIVPVERTIELPEVEAAQSEAPALNPEQLHAAKTICSAGGQYQALLLDGITGSGKTEVYLNAIADRLSNKQRVLVLVPEIGLTPQLVQRFRRRLRGRVGTYHSNMNDSERLHSWLAARDGLLDVVIGTRSAIFLPLPNLGLIVVDEEHDSAFKQQDGARYSARDLALVRAKHCAIPIVLGSATASLESLHNVQQQRMTLLQLRERAGDAKPPTLTVTDIRNQPLMGGLSPKAIASINTTLSRNEQVLVFLNRRGYAPVLMCHGCGWVAECRRCDNRLTLHKASNKLRCHHCGLEQFLPKGCPSCQQAPLNSYGSGTEQLDAVLAEQFPSYKIARIDRDTTRRKGSMETLLKEAQLGNSQLLIGTQMLAKGHDLPQLTLVVVVDADQGLFNTDFRGPERFAQQLLQVAGRAGRAELPGQVLVQTHHPEHPLFQQLFNQPYQQTASGMLQERRQAQWPPYAALALIRAEANKSALAKAFLQAAASFLQNEQLQSSGVIPAPMARRAGRYRMQLLLKAPSRQQLQAALRGNVSKLYQLQEAKRVRWSIDIDPVDIY